MVPIVSNVQDVWIPESRPGDHEVHRLLLDQLVLFDLVAVLQDAVLKLVKRHANQDTDLHRVRDILLAVPSQSIAPSPPSSSPFVHILLFSRS